MLFLVSFFLAYNSRLLGVGNDSMTDDQSITWVIDRQDILLQMVPWNSRDLTEQKPMFLMVIPHIYLI